MLETTSAYRVAIYAAPPRVSALAQAADSWFLPDPARDHWLAEPSLYGFHGTLKAPFRLAEGQSQDLLEQAMSALAAELAPQEPVQLVPAILGSFVALMPDPKDMPRIAALAGHVVRAFEPFRAPLTPEEIARRRQAELTPAQDALMLRWGYPYVFQEFRFHMTLSGRLPDKDARAVLELARSHFAEALSEPMPLDRLWLFVQPVPGARFQPQRYFRLSGGTQPTMHATGE